MIWVETPTNPTLTLVNLNKLAKLKEIIKVVDNTFASPINQRPIEWSRYFRCVCYKIS